MILHVYEKCLVSVFAARGSKGAAPLHRLPEEGSEDCLQPAHWQRAARILSQGGSVPALMHLQSSTVPMVFYIVAIKTLRMLSVLVLLYEQIRSSY